MSSDKLKANENILSALIALIPQRFYSPTDLNDPSYQHNPKNKKPKQLVKEMSKKGKALRYAAPGEASTDNAVGEEEKESVPLPPPEGFKITLEKTTHEELKAKLHRKLAEISQRKEVPKNKQQLIAEERIKRKQKNKKQALKAASKPTLPIAAETDAKAAVKPAESLQFSKVEFGGEKKGNSLDAAALLAKHAAKEEKLAKLPEDKLKEVKEKEMWAKLNLQAQGTVVKDDPKLLKKTLKRKEGLKKKSTKVWADRKKTEERNVEAAQKKRTENITKRNVHPSNLGRDQVWSAQGWKEGAGSCCSACKEGWRWNEQEGR
jgi:Surfeit locus protein 6/60S ribosome biogenesis protein Rrp14